MSGIDAMLDMQFADEADALAHAVAGVIFELQQVLQ
jgi:hypothetical protein